MTVSATPPPSPRSDPGSNEDGKQTRRRPSVVFCANTGWYLYNFRQTTIQALADVVSIVRAFRRLRPDLVFNFTPKCNIYGTLAAGALGIPCVNTTSGVGYLFGRESAAARALQVLYRVTQPRAALVFFQNEQDRELFVSSGYVQPAQARRLMGSGVPLSRFEFAPRPSDGTVRCLFVGRLRSSKGIRVFVDAARVLGAESSIYSFAILGPHDPESPDSVPPQDLEEWVSQGLIEYLGFTDRVEEVLPEYDVVVYPSLYGEGMPRTLLEAAAMGKIGVTSDTRGCREAVTPDSGYVLPEVTADEVCRAIRDYASKDATSRFAMALAARRLAETSFSDESNIRAYVEAAEQVIPKRPGAHPA